jgi:aquaporin Z
MINHNSHSIYLFFFLLLLYSYSEMSISIRIIIAVILEFILRYSASIYIQIRTRQLMLVSSLRKKQNFQPDRMTNKLLSIMLHVFTRVWHYLVVPPLIEKAKRLEHPHEEIDYNAASYDFIRRLFAEFMGTLLVVVGHGTDRLEGKRGWIPDAAGAFSNGLVNVFLIYSLAGLSGAHFNPVVTIAFTCRLVFPLVWVPFYVLAQFCGSLVAGLLLRGLFGDEYAMLATNAIDANNVTVLGGFKWEIFLTFCLLFVILQTATKAQIIGSEAALAVGAVIAFDCLVGGSTSGSSMNPFRTLGPALINSSTDNNASLWIYIAGPLIGALIATVVVGLLQGFTPKTKEEMVGAHGEEHNR